MGHAKEFLLRESDEEMCDKGRGVYPNACGIEY